MVAAEGRLRSGVDGARAARRCNAVARGAQAGICNPSAQSRPRAAEAEEVGGLVAAYGSEHLVLLCSQWPMAATVVALKAQAAEDETESACA